MRDRDEVEGRRWCRDEYGSKVMKRGAGERKVEKGVNVSRSREKHGDEHGGCKRRSVGWGWRIRVRSSKKNDERREEDLRAEESTSERRQVQLFAPVEEYGLCNACLPSGCGRRGEREPLLWNTAESCSVRPRASIALSSTPEDRGAI